MIDAVLEGKGKETIKAMYDEWLEDIEQRGGMTIDNGHLLLDMTIKRSVILDGMEKIKAMNEEDIKRNKDFITGYYNRCMEDMEKQGIKKEGTTVMRSLTV